MKKKKIIILLIVLFLVLLLILPFGISALLYHDNFGKRFETYAPLKRSVEEFEGLHAKRYTFLSNDGQQLVGYQYKKETGAAKGLVVLAHGLGGGGHNSYMDIADYLASNGYLVFAYDATGNDESGGKSINGIPQGLIDLDYAIRFVKETEEFDGLPILLFGHSWGAYSVGSVLNIHPDVKAVVMVSGFNKSTDIIENEGRKLIGQAMNLFTPYFSLLEKIKFGRYASYHCLDGLKNTEADVMIIHSSDDPILPKEKSYDIFYSTLKDNPRFRFIQYEDRGHSYIYYTDAARQSINEYLESSPGTKDAPPIENLDKRRMFELDKELMQKILLFYDQYAH